MSQKVEEELVHVLERINKRISVLERLAWVFGGYMLATAPDFLKMVIT